MLKAIITFEDHRKIIIIVEGEDPVWAHHWICQHYEATGQKPRVIKIKIDKLHDPLFILDGDFVEDYELMNS